MKKAIRKIFDGFNALVILGLLLSFLAPYINPLDFWPIAFFGLTFKFWYLFNFVLLLFWLVLKRKRVLYNIVVLLLGLPFIGRNIQFQRNKPEDFDFKVLVFNTNVQQVYAGGNTTTEINELLKQGEHDVAVFIEWLDKKGSIDRKLYPFQVFVPIREGKNRLGYGMKIVSKHNILDWERIPYNHFSNNMSVMFDVDIQGNVVRFIGSHLQSNHIASEDYHTMLDMETDSEYRRHALDIILRLRRAFKLRAEQTRLIKESQDKSPYPVIIMGDLNDTPQSFAYRRLRDGKRDAFVEAGKGWGASYNKPFSLLRIDYILYDKGLNCTRFEMNEKVLSDHKVLEAQFLF